ncbi:hypothetical protein X474_15765 [Dethiosulfatarculus sandiegensis]|uniref:Uncharacterized protein n=1 Tax=Dethiosulfatarculus sandiegensis TaxID=1429043 RepID=A0A0D2JU87_9BACT|nr:hypothetical protein X474_15765 [Dethiosulfatarculus sandiegensis]
MLLPFKKFFGLRPSKAKRLLWALPYYPSLFWVK